MAESKHDKTEAPSRKRLEDAWKRGSIPRSRDLGSACALLATASILTAGGRYLGAWLVEVARSTFAGQMLLEMNGPREAGEILSPLLVQALVHLAPFLLIALAAALAAGILQSGLRITVEPLKPNLNRFHPKEAIGRLLPKGRVLWAAAKNVTVVALLSFLGYRAVEEALPRLLDLASAGQPVLQTLGAAAALLGSVMLRLAFVLLLVGVADYLLAWRKHRNDLKMSKQELREEMKEHEGSPQVKGKRKQIAQRYSLNRMLADVPKADTVVTNPTHYAIAIRYRRSVSPAPLVLAKGSDALAQKIKAIARHHGIVMVENRPLARALYATSKVGKAIPVELYRAVAEVLVYVYRLSPPKDRDAAQARGPRRGGLGS